MWEGHDEQEDEPTLAELKCFIKYAEEIKDLNAEAATISVETSEDIDLERKLRSIPTTP